MGKSGYGLDDAYSISTPEDARQLYDDWASSYDSSFAEAKGYVAHRRIAATFLRLAGPGDDPVLDIGAGTGLLAEAVTAGAPCRIDGVDISPGMLKTAEDKGVYRALVEADLTGPLPFGDDTYGGLVSSGTFTHGHVGPGVLPELLRIAKPGALCVFGVKLQVFDEARFGSAFARLVAERRITPLDFEAVRVYERDDHDHAEDVGLTVMFRTIA